MDSAWSTAIAVGGTVIVGVAGFGASIWNTRKTTAMTLQGQVTDRYSKAIEQLGSHELDVRIGGIYALERIARDSPRDHPTIMEVLAAFIRRHSHEPWPPAEPGAGPPTRPDIYAPPTRPDVYAAVTVIGRRIVGNDSRPINLFGAIIRGADLTSPDLTRVRLHRVDLVKADLTGANLTDADLTGANLTDADLTGANLTGADLTGADLTGADWPADKPAPPGWQRDTDSGRLKKIAGDSGSASAE
jgi:hypothetical protein